MKTGSKIFTIVCCALGGALLLAACALFVTGMALEDWDFTALNTARYQTRTQTFTGIEDIDISYPYADIAVQTDEGAGEITLSYPVRVDRDGNDLGYTQLTAKDGLLRLTAKDKPSWNFGFGIGIQVSAPQVVLTLPATAFGDISIGSDAGKIAVEGVTCGNLLLSADLGDIEAKDVSCTQLTATASAGAVAVYGAACEGAQLTADLGEVRAENVQCGALTCTSQLGSARIERLQCEKLSVDVETGDIELEEAAVQSIELSVELGDIDLRQVDAQELDLAAEMGSIEGTLAGTEEDYTIGVTANMGSSNIADRFGGTRTLVAATEMGDITITFLGA